MVIFVCLSDNYCHCIHHNNTVEPPNKGHFGNGSFVLSSEVVLISEVHHILIVYEHYNE